MYPKVLCVKTAVCIVKRSRVNIVRDPTEEFQTASQCSGLPAPHGGTDDSGEQPAEEHNDECELGGISERVETSRIVIIFRCK